MNATRKPTVVVEPSKGLVQLDLGAVWQHRELLYFFIWRDVKVRYKQTAIGTAWAVVQPLTTMVIFTVIFGHFAKIPSDGLPYPIFAYTALLSWTLFATALNRCTLSVAGDAHLIPKIYFPRLITPLSATIAGILDFAVAFVILLGMMAWFGVAPGWSLLALPVFVLLALVTALAVGLWLSALNVYYRDVGHAIPLLTQFWMYVSPVAYPSSLIPQKWRPMYDLNPMAGVIEGFRWALLGKASPDFVAMAMGTAVVIVLLIGGLIYFKQMERTFADMI